MLAQVRSPASYATRMRKQCDYASAAPAMHTAVGANHSHSQPLVPAGHYDAQDFAKAHARELGMKTVPSLNVVYTEEKG